MQIGQRKVAPEASPYIIAELSGNHRHDINKAKALIRAAADAGADAAKLQTYTPDTLTLNVDNERFRITEGLWKGRTLYDLYQEAHTPWGWTAELAAYAKECGITLLSTPFDESAVDYLEEHLDPPAYKIGSHELIHIPLLRHVAKTGKPIIMSTGMGREEEIAEALACLKQHGCPSVALLRCVSAYPAEATTFNLKSMQALAERFKCLVGLSDHSAGNEVCIASVALGGSIIERHITLPEDAGQAIDSAFSLQPEAFAEMVASVRKTHAALGDGYIGPLEQERLEEGMRRSIFVSKNINEGDCISADNVRIVRPNGGLAPKHWDAVLGQKAKSHLEAGNPLLMSDLCC